MERGAFWEGCEQSGRGACRAGAARSWRHGKAHALEDSRALLTEDLLRSSVMPGSEPARRVWLLFSRCSLGPYSMPGAVSGPGNHPGRGSQRISGEVGISMG